MGIIRLDCPKCDNYVDQIGNNQAFLILEGKVFCPVCDCGFQFEIDRERLLVLLNLNDSNGGDKIE